MGLETKAEKRARKARELLLEAQESFADIAATLGGFAAQLEEQGFTPEQARVIATASFISALGS